MRDMNLLGASRYSRLSNIFPEQQPHMVLVVSLCEGQ
jgi:hypothetical protein